MRTLIASICGTVEEFTGTTKADALEKFEQRLNALTDTDLPGVEIEVGYKEYRRIVTPAFVRANDNIVGGDAGDYVWGIDICENGCGETRTFATRAEVIDSFLAIAAEKGEHWE